MDIPKVIYMTYKVEPPEYVFQNWLKLNPGYKIDFSLDADCESFLNEHFGPEMKAIFNSMPLGMFKADIWRLCNLYIHGGIYADVDIVPMSSMDSILQKHQNVTFLSNLSLDKRGIFQALFATVPRNPLLLSYIYDFITDQAWRYPNGPTYSMSRSLLFTIKHCNPGKYRNYTGLKSFENYSSESVMLKWRVSPAFFKPRQFKTGEMVIRLARLKDVLKMCGLTSGTTKTTSTPNINEVQITITPETPNVKGWRFEHTFSTRLDSLIITGSHRNQLTDWKFPLLVLINVPFKNNIYLFQESIVRDPAMSKFKTRRSGVDRDVFIVDETNTKLFKSRYDTYTNEVRGEGFSDLKSKESDKKKKKVINTTNKNQSIS